MSISHRFYESQGIVLSTWSGKIQDAEIIRAYMQLYNNTHWQPGFSEIIDLRDANFEEVKPATLKQLSEMTKESIKGESLRLALLAPSNIDSSLARLYESFTHVPNEATKVFHHLSEAIEWLEASSTC